jgi:hypothetical protein
MRRILAVALLATAGLATVPAAHATCQVGPVHTCDLPANVLRAVDCAVKLQPPCIYI